MMKNFIRSYFSLRIFLLSTLHQLLIALSTYILLRSSKSINELNLAHLKTYIVLFFMVIIFAYFVGVLNNYLLTVHQNNCWRDYRDNLYQKMTTHFYMASQEEKARAHNLVISEAMLVIKEVCGFLKTNYEMLLSIIFNILAISLALNATLGMIIIGSFLVAILLINLLKNIYIGLARNIHISKDDLFSFMKKYMDKIIYLNQNLSQKADQALQEKTLKYTAAEEKYSFYEAVVPLISIIVCCMAISLYILFAPPVDQIIILGVIIALPRILQIFQYGYDLLEFNQKLYFYKERSANINNFTDNLELLDLGTYIKKDHIHILYEDKKLDVDQFLAITQTVNHGYFHIVGDNGTGKSLLLKQCKTLLSKDSVLINPENIEHLSTLEGSTGERFLRLMDDMFNRNDIKILLLDECRANLSKEANGKLQKQIMQKAKEIIIVEVNHGKH